MVDKIKYIRNVAVTEDVHALLLTRQKEIYEAIGIVVGLPMLTELTIKRGLTSYSTEDVKKEWELMNEAI